MGMQTITRYKSMKIFRKNQASYLNIFLLRYYLMDNKFASIGNVFAEIVKSKIHDFYMLNNFIKEIESENEQTGEQKMLIYGVSTLLADYFRSDQHLEEYGSKFISLLKNKNNSGSVDLLGDTA